MCGRMEKKKEREKGIHVSAPLAPVLFKGCPG
jgi:hypothetical protein